MKKQISGNEYDLRVPYYTSSIFITLAGLTLLIWGFAAEDHFKDDTLFFIFLGIFLVGLVSLVLVIVYVPYCYKVEVDESTIYITRTEYIITTPIENTIAIDKNLARNVEGSLLGIKVFFTRQSVFYIHFNADTEYGNKIAYLGESKYFFSSDSEDDEFKKILKG
jgi:hypothetical protein